MESSITNAVRCAMPLTMLEKNNVELRQLANGEPVFLLLNEEGLCEVQVALQPFLSTLSTSTPLFLIPSAIFPIWCELNPSVAPMPVEATPAQQFGHDLNQLMLGSAAFVIPTEGDHDKETQTAQIKAGEDALDALCASYQIAAAESALERFAQLHEAITPQLPPLDPHLILQPSEHTPLILPTLLAMYDELTTAIFVLPDNMMHVRESDWTAVANWFNPQFTQLLVTTQSHFTLLAQDVLSVAIKTGNIQHKWGHNFLETIPITHKQVIGRALARILDIYCNQLPRAYVKAADNETLLRQVAHDVMNDLLRINFRHEILALDLSETIADAPILRPGDYLDQHKRITAIYQHVGEWVAFYEQLYTSL